MAYDVGSAGEGAGEGGGCLPSIGGEEEVDGAVVEGGGGGGGGEVAVD